MRDSYLHSANCPIGMYDFFLMISPPNRWGVAYYLTSSNSFKNAEIDFRSSAGLSCMVV